MVEELFAVPAGVLGSWAADVWNKPPQFVAEDFLLSGVRVDLRGDAISFYLWAEEDEFAPPLGPWEVRFEGVSDFDITRVQPVLNPGYISTTIAEAPRYALFSEEMDVHVTAAACSVVASLDEPVLGDGEPLAWQAPSDRGRLVLRVSTKPEPMFPWDFEADLIDFSVRTRTFAIHITSRPQDGEETGSQSGWLTLDDVTSLVIVSRVDASGTDGGYLEDIPTDGRTFYIRHSRALAVVTVR